MKLKNLLTTVLMLAVFALAVNSSTLAAAIYVNNNGGVDTRTGQNDNVLDNVNGPVATITRAVQLASDGDTISIAYTGVPYTEPGPPAGIALIDKSITLVSTGAGSNQLEINSVTMNGADKTAAFDGAFTINTLYLQAGTVGGGANITIANTGTIRRDAGSLASAPAFGATVNLQYDASVYLGSEFPTAATVTNNLNITAGTLTVNRAIQIKGTLTIDGVLNTVSDITISGTGTIGGTGLFEFTGATGQTVNITGDVDLGAIALDMTGLNPVLNIVGGDLELDEILFNNGILNMGDNTLILPRPEGASFGGQAFDRSNVSGTEVGHVIGKVQRHGQNGDGAATVNGNFVFPVGTLEGDYRPVFINFTPDYVLGAEVDFIVAHINESPGGTVNLPIPYPDYYWLIKTDLVNISPTQRFDITLVGTDVPLGEFERMRIMRRQDGNPSYPWAMHGTSENYLNFIDIDAGDTIVNVTATSSLGGLVTAGSRFTISIPEYIPGIVSGTVTYDNIFNTPLSNVVVTLNPGGYTAATDANGNYVFIGVANGEYTVTAATTKAWGGVNATDALGILLHTISNPALSGLPLAGADVNNSATVNATDALQILLRVNGSITSFARGDWVFTPLAITVNNGALAGQNLKGLATGDVNRSYTP
jgi:cytoskeletal protein CcmA (bactofilin family)